MEKSVPHQRQNQLLVGKRRKQFQVPKFRISATERVNHSRSKVGGSSGGGGVSTINISSKWI